MTPSPDDRHDDLAARGRSLADSYDVPPATTRPWEQDQPRRATPRWLTAVTAVVSVAIAIVAVAWLTGAFETSQSSTSRGPAAAMPSGPPPVVGFIDPDSQPPPAWVSTNAGSTWMAFGSFCWGSTCADAAEPKDRDDIPIVQVDQSDVILVHLGFDPAEAHGRIDDGGDGKPLPAGRIIEWTVDRGGYLRLNLDTPDHDVEYVVSLQTPAATSTPAQPPPDILDGTWVLYEIGPDGPSRQFARISFRGGGELIGRAACNGFSATWDLVNDQLSISDFAWEDAGCQNSSDAAAESEFQDLLLTGPFDLDVPGEDALTWTSAETGGVVSWHSFEQFGQELRAYVDTVTARAGYTLCCVEGPLGSEVAGGVETDNGTVTVAVTPRAAESSTPIEMASTTQVNDITVVVGSGYHGQPGARFDCGFLLFGFSGDSRDAVDTVTKDFAEVITCPDEPSSDVTASPSSPAVASSSPDDGAPTTASPAPLDNVSYKNTCWEGPVAPGDDELFPTSEAALADLATGWPTTGPSDDPMLAALVTGVARMQEELERDGLPPADGQEPVVELGADTDGNGTDDVVVLIGITDRSYTVWSLGVAHECPAPTVALPGPPAEVLAGTWVLSEIGPNGPSHQFARIEFRGDGELVGRAACNGFTAIWQLSGDELRLSDSIWEAAGCESQTVMAAESEFMDMVGTSPFALGSSPDGEALTWTSAETGNVVSWRSVERFGQQLHAYVETVVDQAGLDPRGLEIAGVEIVGTMDGSNGSVDVVVTPRALANSGVGESATSTSTQVNGIQVHSGSDLSRTPAAWFDCGFLRFAFKDDDPDAANNNARDVAASVTCPEAPSDAAAEFRMPFPGPDWTRPDGSAADTRQGINLIVGLDHCDWESATMLHIPWPLDTVVRDSRDLRQYLWDPSGIFVDNGVADTGIVGRLPDDADFTGFHTAHQELWLAPSDQDEFAYLVDDRGTIRRLSRPETPSDIIACG